MSRSPSATALLRWLLAILVGASVTTDALAQTKRLPHLGDIPANNIQQPNWPPVDQASYDDPAVVPLESAACPRDFQPITEIPLALSVPCLSPGLEFHAGVLLLQPSADNLGWAVVTFEENFSSPVPIATPYWEIQTLEPDYEPGFEIGGRFALAKPGTDFQFNWQHLRTSTSDFVPIRQAQGQWVSPFSQTGPPTAETYQDMLNNTGVNDLRTADGHVYFDYDEVNLDFGQQINIGSALNLRFLAGVSYANLQEQVISNFHGLPPAPNAPFPDSVPLLISLNNTATYWGVGPRFGIDTTYRGRRGLRLVANFAGALLVGRKQPAQYLFTATAPDLAAVGIDVNNEFISSDKYTEVVSAFDGKLGIGYDYRFRRGGKLTLDAGYLASVFNNPFSGYETSDNVLALQIGSLSTASMKQTQSDFTLNGFYLTGGYQW